MPQIGDSSILPVIVNQELHLIQAVSGEVLSSFSIPKRSQILLGDVDGVASGDQSLGSLDLLNVSSKMIWASSSNSALSPIRFGKSGQAMLCKADSDAINDYAVLQGQSLLLRSSASAKNTKISLRKFGQIQALICGQDSPASEIDRLYVLHPAKTASASKNSSSKSVQSKAKLVLSVIDLQSRLVIESHLINVRKIKQLVLADSDGDGKNEICLLKGGSKSSSILCLHSSGEQELALPFGASQMVAGDFLPEANQSSPVRDEFALLSTDQKIIIVSSQGTERELLLANLSASQSARKVRAKIADCR